jgi:ABC-2 type transport system permease protein
MPATTIPTVTMQRARPYLAAFRARFQLMLQYRAAALAGFATQCWWGAIRIMVFAAFYGAHAAAAPISLADAITYVWLGQALLALLPWVADPEIGQAVRTGGVGYDRLRPVDAYGYWYARTLGWMLARALPRAALMLLAAGIVLPLLGLGDWAWQPPAGVAAALLFVPAFALMTMLGTAILMLANVVVAASLNERGVNAVLTPLVIVFSGSLLPLDFFPDALRPFLHVQPFAGLVDIPFRIYFADLKGAAAVQGLTLQAGWTVVLIAVGRFAMERMMRRLEMQGG